MKAKRIILPVFAALLAVMFALTLEQVSAFQYDEEPWTVSSWADLQDAINKVEEGEVIVLEKDIQAGDQDTSLEVPDRQSFSITIDLNGHVLDRNLSDPTDKGNLFNVEGSLTINDSAPDTPHKNGDNDIYSYKIGERTIGVTGGIITGGSLSGNGGAIYVDGGKTLVLNGGTIIGNKASGVDGSNGNNTGQGGGVYIGGSGTFEMNGGAVAGNVAFSEENGDDRYNRGDGGGVYMAGSTFNLNDGTVAGNTAEQDMSNPDHCGNGGGVYLSNGTLNMKGGSIEGNTSVHDSGGGVYMTGGSTLNMEGGSIANNSAVGGGGVLAEPRVNAFNVKNASIEGNQASGDGGGVHLATSVLTLDEGAEISDNSAGGKGGGIFFNALGDAASAHIYMNDGAAICGNQATDGGGVCHDYLDTAFDMRGGIISDNTASGKGGGVYLIYGSMAMSGGTITGNRAATGGGVWTHSWFSIAGESEIFGNLHGNDADAGPDNVFIDKYGPDYYVGIGDALNNKKPIGVWIDPQYLNDKDYRTVTSGYGEHVGAGDPSEHFVSENDGYTVRWNSDGTELLLTNNAEALKYTAAGYEGAYDGAEHSITVNVTEPTEGVTIQYRAAGDQDYQADPPVYTNVGEYDVEYFIRADGVEYSVRDKETVTIKPASQTVTVPKTTYAKTYGNAAFSLGAKTNGDGVLKYSSSNTKVAAVSAAGKVTIKGAGTAKITVYATAGTNYQKSATKTVTVKVGKAANKLKIKRGKTATVKYSAVKTKNQKLGVSKVIAFTNKGQGAKTYAKVSGNKKITIAKKTGKVTVKKGLKKGQYKVKVKIKAAGAANYKASTWKTVTFTITVK